MTTWTLMTLTRKETRPTKRVYEDGQIVETGE